MSNEILTGWRKVVAVAFWRLFIRPGTGCDFCGNTGWIRTPEKSGGVAGRPLSCPTCSR